MAETNWQKCKFLESTENLKPLVKKRFGREPSSGLAREISACLQQGRLFYEAAQSSPPEIRPLQQFYGMVGFAKALITAKSLQSPSTLKQAHGVRDISRWNSRIDDLSVRIDEAGTFQNFNDVVAPLTRLCYLDSSTEHRTVILPTTSSNGLRGTRLSLREILGRIPGLESLYRMTFGDDPSTEHIWIEPSLHTNDEFRIRIATHKSFDGRESLKVFVNRLRTSFPFLENWRLSSAQRAWGTFTISFRNTGIAKIDEFSEMYLSFANGSYEERPVPNDENKSFRIADGLHPLAGGFSGQSYAVSPINGLHISEFSSHHLALYLLSSLVRYRPQIWTHAISRSSSHESLPDDRSLSLIEEFLDLDSEVFPRIVATILNPHEDAWFE